MTRVFIDVNIPMYAGGTPHVLREPSRQVIRTIAAGQLDALTAADYREWETQKIGTDYGRYPKASPGT